MISDLSLGYPYYAAGTLVIKGLEGFVGYLGTGVFPSISRTSWRTVTVAVGLACSSALAYVGITFLSGKLSPTLGGPWEVTDFTFNLSVPAYFWPVVATAAFVAILAIGFRHQMKSGQSVLSVMVEGSEMVAGYYLYESSILTLMAPASFTATLALLAGNPFNIVRALIGLLMAVLLVRSISASQEVGNSVCKGTSRQLAK